MENTQLTQLAATATAGELALADVLGKVKFTRLPAGKPAKSQLVYTSGTVRTRSTRSQKVG